MTRTGCVVLLTCVFAALTVRVGSTQGSLGVAGKWDVTTRMPDRTVTEQWMIQQKGSTVNAKAKGEQGEALVSGTFDGAFLRVTVKDGDKQYKVRATLDGDAMDGSITYGTGKEYLWHAKRSKAK